MPRNSFFRVVAFMTLLTASFVTFSGSSQAFADDDMWTKLGRGISNITTGWMELGYQPAKMAEEKRWPIALAGGIPKGIFYTYMRTMVGLYETVTFFVPAPKNFAPIMEPEYIVPE